MTLIPPSSVRPALAFTRRCGLLVVMLFGFVLTGGAQGPTPAQKAARAFHERDWGSALAFNSLIFHENKHDSIAAARIIVSACASGDSLLAVETLQGAMTAGSSLAGILEQVRTQSFHVGESEIYVRFMLTAIRHCPWIARAIEARLLPYYEFRADGPEIIAFSSRMLSALPQSPRYLLSLARGYLLTGQLPSAAETWKEILLIEPDNYQALLELGNYYYNIGHLDAANPLLKKAFAIRPTPFVQKRLAHISQPRRSEK